MDTEPGFACAGVCNLYAEPSFRSEVVSQLVMWERSDMGEEREGFREVTAEDGMRGWVPANQVAQAAPPDRLEMVTAREIAFRREPEDGSPVIRWVPAGGYLAVESRDGEWMQVVFPDGERGWSDRR